MRRESLLSQKCEKRPTEAFKNVYFVILQFLFSLSECDIEYISPSEYQASSKNDDDDSKSNNDTNGYVDPYEKLVKGNLERLEKEKVSIEYCC